MISGALHAFNCGCGSGWPGRALRPDAIPPARHPCLLRQETGPGEQAVATML